jgi:tetratricopeptide (TPR) repeat protein
MVNPMEQNPESHLLGDRLALAYEETGKTDLAIQTLRKVTEVARSDHSWEHFGRFCLKCGEPQMALEAFKKCFRAPKIDLATAAVAAGLYETAFGFLEPMIDGRPWKIIAWNLLWNCLERKLGVDVACTMYERARANHEGTYFSKIPEAKGMIRVYQIET